MRRILVVDDHAVVRQGVRSVLAQALPDAEFQEASTGPEARECVQSSRWDLIVLDLSLPGVTGLDLLKDVKIIDPTARVIVFSMASVDNYGVRAIRAGAKGFLSKDAPPEELARAAVAVIDGSRYVSGRLADLLADEVAAPAGVAPHEALSDRELQVFELLAKGHSVTRASEMLGLSVKTVSTYRSRLLKKLRMSSNAELVQYAVVFGLIPGGQGVGRAH
jgi:two-component system invasion response regulator UvrY